VSEDRNDGSKWGAHCRRLRACREMTLKALAERLAGYDIHVSYVTVQRMEAGDGMWTEDRLRAVASVFGLLPQQFVAAAELEHGGDGRQAEGSDDDGLAAIGITPPGAKRIATG